MRNEGKDARKFFRSTIKNHRWWDYSFIYRFLIKIFEYMEKNWRKSHYLNSEKDLKNIKLAITYLKLLLNDDFSEKYLKVIDDVYGSLEIKNNTIKRDTEPPQGLVKEAYQKAHRDKTRIKRKFYLLLYKELENWWD